MDIFNAAKQLSHTPVLVYSNGSLDEEKKKRTLFFFFKNKPDTNVGMRYTIARDVNISNPGIWENCFLSRGMLIRRIHEKAR